jgi:hypothetical protein
VDASPWLRLARVREDEAEDGVQAWTHPLGSSLIVSAKMKQRMAWRRGRVRWQRVCSTWPRGCPTLPGRPGGGDVRRYRGDGMAGMSDGVGAAGILLAAAGRQGLDAFDLAAEVSGCGEAAGIC